MIYLDYSATTPVNSDVLETFNKVSTDFLGNANSNHELGVMANKIIASSTKQIENLLNLKDKEIIYTSGSTEANNLAIKGICLRYQNRGKHIITSPFEHSSVFETLKYLETLGFEVSVLKVNEFGLIDLNNLKELLRDDTILVTINAVNSEIGICEQFEEIGNILKDYKCFYHVDLTQAIGKINVNFDNIDLASFSAHKIYGLKGIGALVKTKKIELIPLLHGGKSTTNYRSGTPTHPLIASFSKALRLSLEDIDKKYDYVKKLNEYLKSFFSKYDNVLINSNDYSIPHILNISILNIQSETFMHALEKYKVYVSTKSACSDDNSLSEAVLLLTKDKERAKSSIRISLSHLTTKEEIDEFLKYFDICYKNLNFKK